MTAAEEYTAHHSESLHTIMYKWGWRTFEGMFRRHLLRKAREELRQLRDLRLAALDANTNFDSKDNQDAKQARIDGLHEAYKQGCKILSGQVSAPEVNPIEDDPLFAPITRRATQMHSEINQPLAPQAGMGRKLLEAMP